MRMILHGMADDIGDFDEAAVVLLVQGPKDPALNGFQAVGEVWNGAVTNDVRGIIEKAAIDSSMERQFDFAWLERANGRRRDNIFGEDMGVAIAVGAGRFFWFGRLGVGAFGSFGLGLLLRFGFSAIGGGAVDGQFRLVRIVFAFRCHSISIQDNKAKGLGEQKRWMPFGRI